jgi:hypothetical protein
MALAGNEWASDWLWDTLAQVQNYVTFVEGGDTDQAQFALGQFFRRWEQFEEWINGVQPLGRLGYSLTLVGTHQQPPILLVPSRSSIILRI